LEEEMGRPKFDYDKNCDMKAANSTAGTEREPLDPFRPEAARQEPKHHPGLRRGRRRLPRVYRQSEERLAEARQAAEEARVAHTERAYATDWRDFSGVARRCTRARQRCG